MPPICKFFVKGYCKFGDRCRFEHPGENASMLNSQGGRTGFSFVSALNNVDRTHRAIPSNNNTSGFSFTQALQTVKCRPDDVEMSDVRIDQSFSFAPILQSHPIEPLRRSQQNKQVIANNQSDLARQDYSDIQNLTEEEMRSFQGEFFNFRRIPVRPPPETFC